MNVEDINVVDYSIEDFAQLIIAKRSTFKSLKEKIYSSELEGIEIHSLINKLSIANERINENFSYDAILFYTLIPSRKLHGFSKKYYFDTDKQLKKGYKRKYNQYYMFSILGHFLYFIIIALLMFVNF